ncbi:hypothetical protein FQA39_LY07491 [Lamprigera yunnana]|nr:hypothetical protein FQA39_LY07491 [Lamprigera yunnana]
MIVLDTNDNESLSEHVHLAPIKDTLIPSTSSNYSDNTLIEETIFVTGTDIDRSKWNKTASGKNGFLNAWDFTNESETIGHLANVTESKNIAKEKYNVDTYAVVSDNVIAMVKMGGLLKHSMWHNVVVIMKEFKQPDLEKLIVLNGGHRIKLPAETRWCTYSDCFEKFLGNLEFMKQIVAVSKNKIKPKVKELIFNDKFVDKVRGQLGLHEPICVTLLMFVKISMHPLLTPLTYGLI